MVVKRLKKVARLDIAIVASVAIILLTGVYSVWELNEAFSSLASVTANLSGVPDLPKPAEIKVTLIEVPGCTKCYNFSEVVNALNSSDVNISFERISFDSVKGQQMVRDYGLEKLPALHVMGETNKTAALALLFGTKQEEEGFFMESPTVPYYSVKSGRVVGLVNFIVLKDSSCEKCYDASKIPSQAEGVGLAIGNVTITEYNSESGSSFVRKYNITHVPSVLMSSDVEYYPDLINSINEISKKQSDGYYLMDYFAPYRELSTGRVRGLVEVIYLNDSNCTACYNVSLHEGALRNLDVFIENYSTYDVASAEGASLIAKYNITGVPTILLSPEASAYISIQRVWPTVGTVEADGWYVFRNPGVVGAYLNLTTGEIVNKTE